MCVALWWLQVCKVSVQSLNQCPPPFLWTCPYYLGTNDYHWFSKLRLTVKICMGHFVYQVRIKPVQVKLFFRRSRSFLFGELGLCAVHGIPKTLPDVILKP